jgi:hypothetical protein
VKSETEACDDDCFEQRVDLGDFLAKLTPLVAGENRRMFGRE